MSPRAESQWFAGECDEANESDRCGVVVGLNHRRCGRAGGHTTPAEGGESGTPNYVTYDRVTAYLVAVVQKQQAEINALKAQIQ